MGGQRARALFAMVGGSAVAGAAALIVVASPVPEKVNACAIVPSIPGCMPQLNTGSGGAGWHNIVRTSTVIPEDTQAAVPGQ